MSPKSSSTASENILEEDCISLANHVIATSGLDFPEIKLLSDVGSRFFVQLFDKVFGLFVPEINRSPAGIEDEVNNLDAIINAISMDILCVSLIHINGEDILAGNINAIHDLLEVFEAYLIHCLPCLAESETSETPRTDVADEDQLEDDGGAGIFICGLCGYRRSTRTRLAVHKESEPYVYGSVSSCPICSVQCAGTPPSRPLPEEKKRDFVAADGCREESASKLSEGLAPLPASVPVANLKSEFARIGLRDVPTTEEPDLSRPGTSKDGPSCYRPVEFLSSTSSSSASPLFDTVVFNGETVPKTLFRAEDDEVQRKQVFGKIGAFIEMKDLDRAGPEPSFEKETQTSDIISAERGKLRVRLRPRTEERIEQDDIAQLYGKNLEAKIRSYLEQKTHHRQRSEQMRKMYLRALKKPYRKPVSPLCKKSFLLPYYLKRRVHQATPKKHSEISGGGSGASFPGDAAFLSEIREEFPNVSLSPATVRLMKHRYQKHLNVMHKKLRESLLSKSRTQIQAEEAVKRQKILGDILRKEMLHDRHKSDTREYRELEEKVKAFHRNSRMESARMKHYYGEFCTGLEQKLQAPNYREEQLVKNAFEERLKLEKEQVLQLKQQLKEKQQKDAEHYKIYLDALENFYQTQFSMLAESLAVEKRDMEERSNAQRKVLMSMKRDLRSRMEQEIRRMQDEIADARQDVHFREMDVEQYRERLRDRFSANPLHNT